MVIGIIILELEGSIEEMCMFFLLLASHKIGFI